MDMEQKRNRLRRFWQPLARGEGGYLGVVSPIDDSGVRPYELPPPVSLEEKWLSTAYRVRRAEADTQNQFWGQDAVNNAFVNLGPGCFAAMVGGPYELKPDTVWYDLAPPIKNWETIPVFEADKTHILYKTVEDQTNALCAASNGRYTVSVTDIGGTYDLLFALRGEDLLSDLIEYPESVVQAANRLDDAFLAYFNTCVEYVKPTGCGYTTWMPIPCDAPWYALQCDMSVMISPAMFEDFILPSLDRLSKAIGQSIYHLDGPGEIPHLDMLLSLTHVHAIQWVPLPTKRLANGRFVQDFADAISVDIYKRSLAAGKKVYLLGVRADQVQTIYDAAGCDGVYIQTHCATRKDADALIEHARKTWLVL